MRICDDVSKASHQHIAHATIENRKLGERDQNTAEVLWMDAFIYTRGNFLRWPRSAQFKHILYIQYLLFIASKWIVLVFLFITFRIRNLNKLV